MRLKRVVLVGTLAVALVVVLNSPSAAGSMCHVDRTVSDNAGQATAKASASFLQATSEAFLLFRAIEEESDGYQTHLRAATTLLEGAISDYEKALRSSEDLKSADQFLKARPFDRLQRMLGITPGTLNHTRWQLIAKTVRESPTPAADLIRVCVASGETLKYSISSLKPGMVPTQLRRAEYAWLLVLSHGALISDAFDGSVR